MSHSAMMPRGNKVITPLKKSTLLNHIKLDIIKIAKASSMGVKCHQWVSNVIKRTPDGTMTIPYMP